LIARECESIKRESIKRESIRLAVLDQHGVWVQQRRWEQRRWEQRRWRRRFRWQQRLSQRFRNLRL
jgi:hypothetical protein